MEVRSLTATRAACVIRDPTGGQVAQLVEQRTENPRVGSSILPLATIPNSLNFMPDATRQGDHQAPAVRYAEMAPDRFEEFWRDQGLQSSPNECLGFCS